MNEIVRQLKQCILFRDLSEEVLEQQILPYGNLQEYSKDRYILMAQERMDFFGVLLSGKVHAMHIYGDGNYCIIDVVEDAEIIGADLMWSRSRIAPYYAVAAVPSRVLQFPISMVTEPGMLPEECREQIVGKFLLLVSNENIRKYYRLAILSQKGLRERIMTYLTMQANKRQSSSFSIPFSREELASYLCVNRSALSHELSQMQQEGLIAFRKNRFTLLRQTEAR